MVKTMVIETTNQLLYTYIYIYIYVCVCDNYVAYFGLYV